MRLLSSPPTYRVILLMKSHLHALIVEDNPADAYLQKMALRNILPIKVDVRCTTMLSQACELLHDGGLDVVLLDLGLPDSCGLDTLARIREKDQHTPIVVLTGASDYELAPAALELGAQDFLLKSDISPDALHRVIIQAVHRKHLDLTNHALAENQQAELRARLRLTLSVVSEPVITMDERGNVCDWNRAAEEMLGWRAEEVLGQNLEDKKLLQVAGGRHSHRFSDLIRHDDAFHTSVHNLELAHRDGRQLDVVARAATQRIGDHTQCTVALSRIPQTT
jgi:PAS domain S-box-containing protein